MAGMAVTRPGLPIARGMKDPSRKGWVAALMPQEPPQWRVRSESSHRSWACRVTTRGPEQTGQGHFSVCANRRNQVQMNQRLREVPARKSHNPLPDFHA